jgi:multidrug efflux system membrane fusion protein
MGGRAAKAGEANKVSEQAIEQPPKHPRQRWRSRGRALLLAAAVLVAASLALRFLWSDSKDPKVADHNAPQSVAVATIETGDIRVIVNGLGTVTPLATVNVVTQINGQLTQVAFHEGQLVKKGDFLAQIDPRPYEIMQAQYEGQLVHDQGLLDQAKIDLTRYQTLLKQNSIARQTEEDQVFLVKQYEGSVKTDRALIDQQKLNLIYAHIVSPVDGRVGLRLVDPGNYVQTSTNSTLAVVTQLQPITVIFPVPEDEIPNFMPKVSSGAALPVAAYDRANVAKLAEGELMAVDSVVDTTTGMVKLRARFDNADNKLFPSQFVNARLLLDTLRNVVTVPVAAIQRGAPGTYVYVVDGANKVSSRVLTLGPTDGDFAAVTAGLSAGERVVIEGADRLRDGSLVTVPADAQGKAPAPPKMQPK